MGQPTADIGSMRPVTRVPISIAVYGGMALYVVLIGFVSIFRADVESERHGVWSLHITFPRTVQDAGILVGDYGWTVIGLVLAFLATALTATAVLGIGNSTPSLLPKRDAVISVVDTFIIVATFLAVVPLSGFYFAVAEGSLNGALLGFAAIALIGCAKVLSRASRTLADSDARLLHDDEAFTTARLAGAKRAVERVRGILTRRGALNVTMARAYLGALMFTVFLVFAVAVAVALVAATVPIPVRSWDQFVQRAMAVEIRVLPVAIVLVVLGALAPIPARITYWAGPKPRVGHHEATTRRDHDLELAAQILLPTTLMIALLFQMAPMIAYMSDNSRAGALVAIVCFFTLLSAVYDGRWSWATVSLRYVLMDAQKQIRYEQRRLTLILEAERAEEAARSRDTDIAPQSSTAAVQRTPGGNVLASGDSQGSAAAQQASEGNACDPAEGSGMDE